MTPELEALLLDRYPDILAQRKLPVTASAMGWGCDCRDGWWQILDGLFEVVAWHADESSIGPQTAQIKQKLGSLRVYWDGDDDYIQGATWLAEAISMMTCEVTGTPGRLTVKGGFLQVLCPAEAQLEGAVPTFRAKTTDTAPLRPSEVTFPTVEDLARTYEGTLVGPVDLPLGWMRLADAILETVRGIPGETVTVTAIRVDTVDPLMVSLEGGGERGRGVVRCAKALADRIDPETGAFLPAGALLDVPE